MESYKSFYLRRSEERSHKPTLWVIDFVEPHIGLIEMSSLGENKQFLTLNADEFFVIFIDYETLPRFEDNDFWHFVSTGNIPAQDIEIIKKNPDDKK